MAGSDMPQVSPLPPPPPPQTAPHHWLPRRPLGSPRATAYFGATLFLFGSIAIFVSLGLSWFTTSSLGGGKVTVTSFLPGTQLWTQAGAGNGTAATLASYVSAGYVHVGALYSALFGIGILTGLVTLALAFWSYGRAAGGFRTPPLPTFYFWTAIIVFVLALTLVLMVPLLQPGAYSADVTQLGGACGPSPNPCNSVWGSQSGGGATFSWGPDAGWYVGLVGLILITFGLLLHLFGRRHSVS